MEKLDQLLSTGTNVYLSMVGARCMCLSNKPRSLLLMRNKLCALYGHCVYYWVRSCDMNQLSGIKAPTGVKAPARVTAPAVVKAPAGVTAPAGV
jgi:hypothetical protein